jgi:colicin import membrane protein
MGKVLISFLMCCFLALDVFAQAPAAAPAAPDAAAPVKKTVTRGRKAKTTEAKPAEAATPATPATAATPATPAAPAVHKDKKGQKAHASGTATPGTDKLIGKDAKGHDIYQGPKGGQYYISNGNKQYLDKKAKLKV